MSTEVIIIILLILLLPISNYLDIRYGSRQQKQDFDAALLNLWSRRPGADENIKQKSPHHQTIVRWVRNLIVSEEAA